MRFPITRRSVIASVAPLSLAPQTLFPQSTDSTPEVANLLDSATGPTVGSDDAVVTMHIYNDFQSNFGRDFYFETLPFIHQDFVQTGEVSLVFHDFPRLGTDPEIADPDDLSIEMIDPRNESSLAAQAAMSAGEQGKYFHMCDRLFANHNDVQSGEYLLNNLERMALAIHLDIEQFSDSMRSRRHVEALVKSVESGWEVGITAVPMFILDNGGSNPSVVVNTAEGYTVLKRQIEVAILTAE